MEQTGQPAAAAPEVLPQEHTMHITFGGIHEDNMGELRLLNDTTFPVRYNDKFYLEVLQTLPAFTKYAYHQGMIVGAICCRLEEEKPQPPPPLEGAEGQQQDNDTEKTRRQQKLYIMTLGVLAAYRGRGIGTKLLESVLEAARGPPHAGTLDEIYLHVQTSNEDAIHFYAKFGFVTKELIKNYYKRIDPPDCYVLSLALGTAGAREEETAAPRELTHAS